MSKVLFFIMEVDMRIMAAVSVQLLLVGQAYGYCPKRFVDSDPEVETTIWQPAPGEAVRVAFSDTLDAEKLGAIEAAFQAWADVPCSTLTFEFLDGADQLFALEDVSYAAPSTTPPADIYVFWIDGSAEPPDFVQGFENTIAHTFPRHDRNGKLTSASIALNGASTLYPWGVLTADNDEIFDVQTVMTQLIGEVIGLTSSDLTTGTIMTKGLIYSGLGERAPLEDDQDGLQYLYWNDACTADKRPPPPGADQYCYPAPADAGISSDGSQAGDGGTDGGDASVNDGGPDASVQCTSSDECGKGQICTAEGQCVDRDDGCSCSATADPARGLFGLLLLVGLMLRLKRRA